MSKVDIRSRYASDENFSFVLHDKMADRDSGYGYLHPDKVSATDYRSLVLTVDDNGIGFPEDLDFRHTESLGLQLVTVLVEQIGGTIELSRNSRTEFKITFKELKKSVIPI